MTFWLCLISLISGAIGALFIAYYGYRFGLIDHPNERSSHTRPTPKGGGIGILAAFIFSSLLLEIPVSFWLSATLLALLSFCGDRFDLSPKLRLPLQFCAAIVLFIGIDQFDLGQLNEFILIISLLVFIVGTANFYNFMDGINGIAAITGMVAFGLMGFSILLSGGEKTFAMLSICISFSCLGFLPFNMPKAKVFMGDVGSILLGFVFAGMIILVSNNILDFVCYTGYLLPFYADELTTMAVRIVEGENLTHAHRKHLYQLLTNEKGIAHWRVSVGYGLVQLLIALSILLTKQLGIFAILLLLMSYFIIFAIVSYVIRYYCKS